MQNIKKGEPTDEILLKDFITVFKTDVLSEKLVEVINKEI